MASKSIRQAEKKALDGANESQDTLVIAHYLMKNYGIGLRSSSPVPAAEPSLPSPERSDSQSEQTGTKPAAHPTNPAKSDEACGDSQRSSIPETQEAHLREGVLPPTSSQNRVIGQDGPDGRGLKDNRPQSQGPLPRLDVGPWKKKMDSSQSSTQSNGGRSYDQYIRSTSPGHASSAARRPVKPVGSSSPNRSALADGYIGAVRFGFDTATDTNGTVSPAQDDSGLVDFGSLTHLRHPASQRPALSPETPGPPQNPFRHSRSQLLPTSQLFRGTQFSSPVKLASPTSSRPSPTDFPGNSISLNQVISSPLRARGLRSSPAVAPTSSPDIPPGTTSSKLHNKPSSPVNPASTQNPIVPESSHDAPPRKRSAPEPMSTYETMKKSQERRANSEVRSDPLSSGEDDEFDSIARQRRIKSRKEAALRQLTAISFHRRPVADDDRSKDDGRSRTDDVEVPSTSQRRRTSQAEAFTTSNHETDVEEPGPDNDNAVTEVERVDHPRNNRDHVGDNDSTQSDVEDKIAPAAESTLSTACELPRLSTTTSAKPLTRDSGPEGMSNGDAVPETSPNGMRPDSCGEKAPVVELPMSEGKPLPNFPSSPPAFSTRSRKSKCVTSSEDALSSTSALSNPPSTPDLPSSNPAKTIPAPVGSSTVSTVVASSSPVVAQRKRREARKKIPKSKTASTESLRSAARSDRRGSSSTDEISRSLRATPAFEQSTRASRYSASRSASRTGHSYTKSAPAQNSKLFEGMAFAVSFQARQPQESNEQYSTRMDFSATVQRRIRQAGGRILENGFDELFQAVPMGTPTGSPRSSPGADADINLTSEGLSTGFTALIADGHSRKVKYMQALALGLPCIAARWVTACLDNNRLVDWAPYLLCAGQSAFLGGAIRSRTLAPYDAATARLSDVISRRPKLLEGSRILAVVKKALEARKMAYVFLARVLGASLKRVYSIEEAKKEMKAAEDAGAPFDWVYVDGKADEDALFGVGSAPGGKKRKRATATSFRGSAAAEQPLKRARTLGDELVIQSLILGRLIEEGEMTE
ncbi:hypothetical protein VTK26DRAFT_8959 [Humicola hyalothermophila]